MKVLQIALTFALFFALFFPPVNIFAQDEQASDSAKVDVYGLFWPVVPGTTVADSTFFLKQLKEMFGGMMTFGTVAKSEYQIELSEKRLVEATKLVDDKNYSGALKSIDLNEEARASALDLKKKAVEEKAETLELTNKMVKSLQNQEKALMFLATQIPDDQEGNLKELLKELPLQISEAK